ncbi:MAG TPA: GNAT family N-acetyltransferase [Xanthomonadales bacterium]|nr:GNAT family N-acetyltransferase [Xanthomonadales bacterium]
MTDPRDNPFWAALTSAQSHLASGTSRVKRYAADVAPFVAIAEDADPRRAADDVATLVSPDESVVLVGVVLPADPRFEVEQRAGVLQMDYAASSVPGEPESFAELGLGEVDAMLALTGLVYPGYFRRRTPLMGRYHGVFDGDGRLVAMAGERMRTDTHCEISGVCTHPDFVGRGLAGRLVRRVTAGILARGERAFLHVSPENTRAVKLYEALGFATRRELPLLRARRLPSS